MIERMRDGKVMELFTTMSIETNDKKDKEKTSSVKEKHEVRDQQETNVCLSCCDVLNQVDTREGIFGTTKRRSWSKGDMLRGLCTQCNNCSQRVVINSTHENSDNSNFISESLESRRSSSREEMGDSVKESQSESLEAKISYEQTTRKGIEQHARQLVQNVVASATQRLRTDVGTKEDCNKSCDQIFAKEIVAKIVTQAKTQCMIDLLGNESPNERDKMKIGNNTVNNVAGRLPSSTACEEQHGTDTPLLNCEDVVTDHHQMNKKSIKVELKDEQELKRVRKNSFSYANGEPTNVEMFEEKNAEENEKFLINIMERRQQTTNTALHNCEMQHTGNLIHSCSKAMSQELESDLSFEDCNAKKTTDGVTSQSTNPALKGVESNRLYTTETSDDQSTELQTKNLTFGVRLSIENDDVIPEESTSLEWSAHCGLRGDRRPPIFRRTMSESQMPERKRWIMGELSETPTSSELESNLSSKRRSTSCPVVSEVSS